MRRVNLGRSETWTVIEVVDMRTFTVVPGPLRRVPTTDELLIAFTADGRPRAITPLCPHRGMALAEFARPGSRPGTIVCAAHRCEFDVETGANLTDARDAPLATWPLVLDGHTWFAELGGPPG